MSSSTSDYQEFGEAEASSSRNPLHEAEADDEEYSDREELLAADPLEGDLPEQYVQQP